MSESGRPIEFPQLHKAVLDCMSEGVFVVDRSMNILYSNPAAETLTGFTADESLGRRCSDIFCEASEVCKGRCPPQRAIHQHESVLHREAETKMKDGRILQTQISVSPFFDGGQCTGAVIVLKDITELRKAEERLKTQSHFLEIVINSLLHPFRVIDAQTFEIRLANEAEKRQALSLTDTCHGATYGRKTPCSEEHVHYCPVVAVRESGNPTVVEHTHDDAEGNPRHYEVHCYPIKRPDGEVRQVIQYSIDITDRKLAEEERERLIEELKAALAKVKQLGGLLPICSSCKKIRDDQGYWNQIELYIRNHSEAEFSHSICPDCATTLYPFMKDRQRSRE